MSRISDRSLVGTIVKIARQTDVPHVGLQGNQRFQRNKARLRTFQSTLPVISTRTDIEHYSFLPKVARSLEQLWRLPGDCLEIVERRSKTYRKTTVFNQVNRFGTPWLILKVFSERHLGHESLRALREHDGVAAFGRIADVQVPSIYSVFSVTGPKMPAYNLVVAETLLPGMPVLNHLELVAGKSGEERMLGLEEVEVLLSSSAAMLSLVHTQTRGDVFVKYQGIQEEALGLLKLARDDGLVSQMQAIRIAASMDRCQGRIAAAKTVLCHRDYTSNNMLANEADERPGIIDLEKSELEYPAKDLAKFTETLFIDGKSVGLNDQEVAGLQEAFLQAYFSLTKTRGSVIRTQLQFYQFYSVLSLMNYQLKQGNYDRCELLRDRLLGLL